MENLPFAFFSLICPFFGLARATLLLDLHFTFGKDQIGKAIAQGSVMVAVRSKDWEPPAHDQFVYVGLPQGFFADTERSEIFENNNYSRIDIVFTAMQIIPRPYLRSSLSHIVLRLRRPPIYSMAKHFSPRGTSGAFSTPIVLTTCSLAI